MTVATERVAEVAALVARCVAWSRSRPDVRALAVVGSWAYGTPRSSSDVDVVLLTTDPEAYLASDGWAEDLDLGQSVRTEDWGAVTERRFRLESGLEVEVNIGTPGWAGVDPVDEGTRRVVTDGLGILHDPRLLLATLAEACSVSGRGRRAVGLLQCLTSGEVSPGRGLMTPGNRPRTNPPVVLDLPFQGTWLARNSPGTRVPSHGTHAFATTYAIDLIGVLDGRSGRTSDWRTLLSTEPPERFYGFGCPILAPHRHSGRRP